LIKEEEQNYRKIAEENKKKLEELHERHEKLATENDVI